MSDDPFGEHFMCNFSDAAKPTGEDERLQQIWCGEDLWTCENLLAILDRWECDGKQKIEDVSTELLYDSIQLSLAFVQNNFTGPFDKVTACSELLATHQVTKNCDAFECLKASGEELNANVKNPELLLIAKQMITRLLDVYPLSKVILWWRLRLIQLHQHVLDDLANDLYQQLKSTAETLKTVVQPFDNKELQALLMLELANGYLQFHRTDMSAQLLDEVCATLHVELKLEGLLGLRTRFQQKPLPQLCLTVVRQPGAKADLPAALETNTHTKLPQLLLLEDDTRLERVRFIEPEDNEVMTLPSILQVLVLAKVKQLKRSQPKDRLADEELEPYTQTLLYQTHGPLQVRQAALLLNCQQEAQQRRTVERSWKQCEQCVQMLDNVERYTLRERISYGFASYLQPKWQTQLQLVDLLRSLGMTKTALDICLQIQAWEQVIDCYTSLELRHKAAEIINQQLAKKPTALLYCLLGDATDDVNCYEQAWLHSKETSGKAQAYWGNYYYRKANYVEALKHYEKSLKINLLQEPILLRCGYCAMQQENWEMAVHAYLAYTHLEPNGFESWNNLAKAFIKLGDKQRAHRVLNESLKCNFSNWKVWENFMLVSVDTAHWQDAIRSYQRLGELKQHFLDTEVLTRIVYGVSKLPCEGADAAAAQSILAKRINTLLAQQCVQHNNEPLLWELAALVAKTPLRKAERLIKAYRAYTGKQLGGWQNEPQHAIKVIKLCLEAINHSLAAINQHDEDENDKLINSQLSSTRMAANSCLSVLERSTLEPPLEQQELMQQLQQSQNRLSASLLGRMADHK